MRFPTLVLVAFVLLTLLWVGEAARVCKTADCSDVVGHGMVQDSKTPLSTLHEEVHDREQMEHLRQKRLNILKKERATA